VVAVATTATTLAAVVLVAMGALFVEAVDVAVEVVEAASSKEYFASFAARRGTLPSSASRGSTPLSAVLHRRVHLQLQPRHMEWIPIGMSTLVLLTT